MDSMISLKEVCVKYNVSRRAIQGYEKLNLVKPSGKNKMGHLLYDSQTQQRVRKIHQFQQFGFQLKEIVHLIDAPNEILKEELLIKLQQLEKRQCELEDVLQELKELIQIL